jgi:dimeric dUTPase (all-alpha-NTP-PPase superfamily)
MSKILTMLELQQSLNDNTNGEGWERGLTKQGKIINWKRCIYLESAELIESYPWKHWKNIDAKVDRENVKIELVDIWHFVMSEALRVAKLDGVDIANLSSEVEELVNQADAKQLDDYYKEIESIESFIQELFCNFELKQFIVSFITLSKELGLELDELYKLYLGKNILNKFRQDHGYKDGSYIKIWNGKEDNVVMQEILDANANIDANGLYEELEERYKLA